MGTSCAPLVADFCLFCYERDFMLSLSGNNQTDIIEAFNSTPGTCADTESFVRWGPTLTFFLPLKAGHHRAFRWRADGGPTLNAGLVAL